jgi:hypothetical protein
MPIGFGSIMNAHRMHLNRARIIERSPLYGVDYHDVRSPPSSHDRRAEHVPEPARDQLLSCFDGATASSHCHPKDYMEMLSRPEYDCEPRPPPPRRLLDRLSFSMELDNVAPPPSLHDCVQVPLKRDRNDVENLMWMTGWFWENQYKRK